MTAFHVTEHVQMTLRSLEESAIADHATAYAAGLMGASESMAARADRWRTLAEVSVLLDEDPVFAKAYAAAAVARSAASAAARHPGDEVLAAEADAADQWRREIPADPRTAMLNDARRMLDYLTAHPELPVDQYALRLLVHTKGTHAERMDAVDAAAEVLGTASCNDGPAGYHYQATRQFGSVCYNVTAVPSDPDVKWLTRTAGKYGDNVEVITPAAKHCPIHSEPPAAICHAYDEPLDLDEDQPTSHPATPASGHGQDDAAVLGAHLVDADEHDPDDEDDFAFLDDELVTHAFKHPGGGPRCGDTEPDPVYSNRPTCATCASLVDAGVFAPIATHCPTHGEPLDERGTCPVDITTPEQQAARAAEDRIAAELAAYRAAAEDADPGQESHYTQAQLDGEACTQCGADFAEGQPTVPSGYDFIEGQLFAHAACMEERDAGDADPDFEFHPTSAEDYEATTATGKHAP